MMCDSLFESCSLLGVWELYVFEAVIWGNLPITYHVRIGTSVLTTRFELGSPAYARKPKMKHDSVGGL